jgi:hypothetical protein
MGLLCCIFCCLKRNFYSYGLIIDNNANCMGQLLWLELFYFLVV